VWCVGMPKPAKPDPVVELQNQIQKVRKPLLTMVSFLRKEEAIAARNNGP
jgi:hypothetical protein